MHIDNFVVDFHVIKLQLAVYTSYPTEGISYVRGVKGTFVQHFYIYIDPYLVYNIENHLPKSEYAEWPLMWHRLWVCNFATLKPEQNDQHIQTSFLNTVFLEKIF